jgi:aryl-alcohol dehydrogenase-like predicted oxidoreductase
VVSGRNDDRGHAADQTLLAGGFSFIDTAEVYGFGKSEQLVGACVKRGGQPAVGASKFAPYPTRISQHQFMTALDATLARIGMPNLDL